MKVRDFSKIFFAILFLHVAVIYKPQSEVLYLISKPLLLFSLLAFFIHRTAHISLKGKNWVAAALLASLVGDLLLIKPNENLFLAGMGAFALAHIFFVCFYINQKLTTSLGYLGLGAVVAGAGIFVLYQYVQVPPGLELYLYGYALLIGAHLLASTRMMSTATAHARLPVLGAVLFILSDILLAFNKFNGGDKYWQMAVMLTYGVAQYLITIGLVSYLENRGAVTERPSG